MEASNLFYSNERVISRKKKSPAIASFGEMFGAIPKRIALEISLRIPVFSRKIKLL